MTIQIHATGRNGHFGHARDTAHRRWVEPQAGRIAHRKYVEPKAKKQQVGGGSADDGEWGTTTAGRELRSYSAAEMGSCRGRALHKKTCLDPATLHSCSWRGASQHRWLRNAEHFPDYGPGAGAVAVATPCTYEPSQRPIRPRRFVGSSLYRVNDLQSHAARGRYFGREDEPSRAYAPLPTHIVDHLIRTRVPESEFGREPSMYGGAPSAVTESGWDGLSTSGPTSFRSESAPPSTASGMSEAVRRIEGGLAKRRAGAFFRAPNQSDVDRLFIAEKRAADGSNIGLQSANFPPSLMGPSISAYADRLSRVAPLLSGTTKPDAPASLGVNPSACQPSSQPAAVSA